MTLQNTQSTPNWSSLLERGFQVIKRNEYLGEQQSALIALIRMDVRSMGFIENNIAASGLKINGIHNYSSILK